LSTIGSTPDSGIDLADPGRLYRCQECALFFRHPALSPNEADALYETIAGDDWQYPPESNSAWQIARKRIERRPTGRILDIGSFDGRFLAMIPPAWKKAAIEPNPLAVSQLKGQGIDAIPGNLTAEVCHELRGRFDVVTMFDVFEHLHDPAAGMELAAGCVRPGGVLWVSTGNSDHWTWRLLGSEHPYLATVQHVVVGGESWFRRFCARNGWRSPRFTRISHRVAAMTERARAAALAGYFGTRRRGWPYRGFAHIVHRLPAARRWLHRTYMPHIAELKDHVFVEISL